MSKAVGDMNTGGKNTVPDGDYKFAVKTVKVVLGGSGHAYAVVGAATISGPVVGSLIEIGFSFSPNAEGICYAWLKALGFVDSDVLDIDDVGILETQIKAKAVGKYLEATLKKVTNKQGYDGNEVTPPWDIRKVEEVSQEEVSAASAVAPASAAPAGDDRPEWAK